MYSFLTISIAARHPSTATSAKMTHSRIFSKMRASRAAIAETEIIHVVSRSAPSAVNLSLMAAYFIRETVMSLPFGADTE